MSSCGGGGSGSSSTAEGRIAFGAEQGGEHGLYVVRPDGGGLERLSVEAGPVSFPVWAPEADRIAYAVGAPGGTGSLRVYSFDTHTSATVSESALIGLDGPTASWSGDSSRLAFLEASDGGALRVYDADQGQRLDPPGVRASAVDWSPSDDELAVVSVVGDAPNVFLVPAEGGELRRVTDTPDAEQGLRWSPDGDRLAYWTPTPDAVPAEGRLLVVQSNGSSPEQLAEGRSPAWSPDGDRIAYSGPSQGGAGLDIYIIDADGGESRRVAQAVTDDRFPNWSPDGHRLIYLGVADLQTAFICVVRLDPEAHDCLDLPGLVPSAPAWSSK